MIDADDADAALALLGAGEPPGDPPLYLAARAGKGAVVAALLGAGVGADTPSVTRGGTTPLHAALFFGHRDVAEVLLDAGADPMLRNRVGFAAFDWALEREEAPILVWLLDRIASGAPEAEAPSYALARAVLADDGAALGRLLASGADPDAPNGVRYPALALAARFGHADRARQLVDAGADPDVGRVELDEASPLHQAARGGQVEAARLLLGAGADREKRNARGFTPLHLAALYDRGPMAALLLAEGIDPAVRSSDPDPILDEFTAFDLAAERGTAVADTLLSWAARHARDPGPDLLARAAFRGDLDAVQMLLASGVDPNAPSTPGALPLALAAGRDHGGVAQALLDAGADPDRRQLTRYQTTALMETTRADRADMAELLLDSGADPDRRDRYGDTALAWAASLRAEAVAEALLAGGAETTTRGLLRRTPAEIARQQGATALAQRIEATR